jgi:serine/threonine protein kinase
VQLGPFELIRKLGAGATAEVFLASGPSDALIALKVMLPELAQDESTRRAFLHEGRTAALLRHPNIVEVFEVGEAEGRGYLVMELVRGWSLAALVKRMRAAKQSLPIDEGCEAIRQAALGLHFAHEIRGADGKPLGLVHRDVSPQNLIVAETGEVKVADFGLAKSTQTPATVIRGIKGKLNYMPPEQLRIERLDRRCDVFALGAVLWELITGQALYPGASEAEIFQQALFNPLPHPDEVTRGLSRAVVDLLQRAVQRPIERRIPTALALAELLLPLTRPGESAQRLGARLSEHFEPLPRSLAEVTGRARTHGKRRGVMPRPSARLGEEQRKTDIALQPLQSGDENQATMLVARPEVFTDPEHTFEVPALRRRRSLLLPALVFAFAGLLTATVWTARYLQQHAPASYEVIDESADAGR